MPRQLNFRFAAVLLAFTGLVWLTYREAVLGAMIVPLTELTAQIATALIDLCGMEAVRSLTVISHPDGFAYEIYYRCTGILPAAFLAVAILAYPGALRQKWCAVAMGVPLLMALNLIRLVRLFHIGVYHTAAFDAAHAGVWRALIIFAIAGLWLGWTRWSDALSGSHLSKESHA
jgi:exosortase/archaeosortase family protein